MTVLTVFAGVCGLAEGLAGLIGTLIIFICVDYPTVLFRDEPPPGHNWTHPGTLLTLHPPNVTGGDRVDLKPITIMAAGYSSDPDREIIFCFSIMCSVFSIIWIISSIFIFIGSTLKSARLLWFWVLSTMAVSFLDFVGAIFFASKTGGYIMFFEDSREQHNVLSDSTISFLKYKYPVILLIVFGRGIVTVPVNVFLAMLVHRKAGSYHSMECKRLAIPQSILAFTPSTISSQVKNGTLDPGPTNGFKSSAVYTNESFTPDEKY